MRIWNHQMAVFIAQSKEEEIKVKMTELEQWESRQVYKEVEDTNQ